MLFDVGLDRIEVVVHPQSIVHALVRFRDGALLAHVGLPDMRVPISYALTHPARGAVPDAPRLDLASVGRLDFEPPDMDAFPCLRLAREAAVAGGAAPAVLNAANEIAVAAFLDGRLPFTGIPEVVDATLDHLGAPSARDLDEALDIDRRARRVAADAVASLAVPA
jgi:1-deoxy-D-xylulose-5-phosphate reductoisomerase